MLIGAHVKAGGGLVPALGRGAEIGADVIQVFTQSPRAWKPNQYAPAVLEAYRTLEAAQENVHATYCHATYLINLATSDKELLERSCRCLAANLGIARGIGARGLILHVGSHRGDGLTARLPQIVDSLCGALDEATPGSGDGATDSDERCPILLENAAGAGGTVGRTFDELASIIDRVEAANGLGVCLDTQHLWASGADFSTIDGADAVVEHLDDIIGVQRLGCIHLNDSKVDFGANRDRHENIGEGTIGRDGLAALLGHPKLKDVPAILEVPGTGDGPRAEDVITAREVAALGTKIRHAA